MDEEKPSLRYKSCQESYLNLFTLLYHNILELYKVLIDTCFLHRNENSSFLVTTLRE